MTILLFWKDNEFYKSTLSLLMALTMGLTVGILFKNEKTETAASNIPFNSQLIPSFRFSIGGGLLSFVLTLITLFVFFIEPSLGKKFISLVTKATVDRIENGSIYKPNEEEVVDSPIVRVDSVVDFLEQESQVEVVPPPPSPVVVAKSDSRDNDYQKKTESKISNSEDYGNTINLKGPKDSGY